MSLASPKTSMKASTANLESFASSAVHAPGCIFAAMSITGSVQSISEALERAFSS